MNQEVTRGVPLASACLVVHEAWYRNHIRHFGRSGFDTLSRCTGGLMGLTHVAGTVKGPSGEDTLDFLVDSGATYTILPRSTWKRIGLTPKRTLKFTLVDATKMTRDVSECYIEVTGGEGHTPVVLGKGADEAVLGVVTLEQFGLLFNPFTRTLQPMRLILA